MTTDLILDPLAGEAREVRMFAGEFEIRRAGGADSHMVEFRGYASVTDHLYPIAGGPEAGGFMEQFVHGAFKRDLGRNEPRALVYFHDQSRVMSTTRSADPLRMAEDSVGLHVETRLNTRVSWINDLVEQINDGTIQDMSVGFRAVKQQWSANYQTRSITEARVFEATLCWRGYNPVAAAVVERAHAAVLEARAAAAAPTLDRVAIAAAAARARLDVA